MICWSEVDVGLLRGLHFRNADARKKAWQWDARGRLELHEGMCTERSVISGVGYERQAYCCRKPLAHIELSTADQVDQIMLAPTQLYQGVRCRNFRPADLSHSPSFHNSLLLPIIKPILLTTIMSTAVATKQNGAIHLHELQVIDYARLKSHDEAEMDKLLQNARAPGAFYLDLRNETRGADILRHVEAVYQLSEGYFDQLPAWKLDDVRNDQKPSQDRGYADEVYLPFIKWILTL